MSLIRDYGLSSPSKTLPILLFYVSGKLPNTRLGKLQIHKMIRYFETLTKKVDIQFSNYNLGAVSSEVYESLDELQDDGLLDVNDHEQYTLSSEGLEAAKELADVTPKDNLEKLSDAFNKLYDLTTDELLFFMYNEVPESQVNSKVIYSLNKHRPELVQSIYDKGKISASIALSWVPNDDDKDKLDLNVNEEYVAKLSHLKKEKTVSGRELFL